MKADSISQERDSCISVGPLCLLLLGMFAGSCDEAAAEGPSASWFLSFENDVFYGTDRHYTNGVEIGRESPTEELKYYNGKLSKVLARGYGDCFSSDQSCSVSRRFSLGQLMYTPSNITVPTLMPDDRPYGGWLYLRSTIEVARSNRRDSFRVSLGMVGQASLAESTQKWVHRQIDSPRPQGWEHQISNEPTLQLGFKRWLRLAESLRGEDGPRLLDFSATGALEVGNVFRTVGVGGVVRSGWNVPDFYLERITPVRSSARASNVAIYLQASVEGRWIAGNIFLDGNTFRDSHSVDARDVVVDWDIGLNLRWRRLIVAYRIVGRSREFVGQAKPNRFGSITIGLLGTGTE